MSQQDLGRIALGVEIAVRDTARFIRREKKAFVRGDAEFKGPNDLVSYVDRTAELQLVEAFAALIPDAGFINEESGETSPNAEWVWVIDPLDGTTNFVYDLPVFCISVGLLHQGERVLGVVHEINRDEYFLAIKGRGASLNRKPIQVSQSQHLHQCLLATGFPFREHEAVEGYLGMLKQFMKTTKGIRRLGSAALDLAYTACGRFDGFFESNLAPWDVAAGSLLVEEAGGRVTDYQQGDNFLFGRSIVAGTPAIQQEMLVRIQEALQRNGYC